MVSAGPPTRLRYLVASAIGSLSRLRLGMVQGRRSALEDLTTADCTSVKALAPSEPDLLAAAHLCTELGRVDETREVGPLLQEAATIRCGRPHPLGVGSAGHRTEAHAGTRIFRQGDRAVTESTARHRQCHRCGVSIGSNVRGQWQRFGQWGLGGSFDDASGVYGCTRHRAAARWRAEGIGARARNHFRRAAGHVGRDRAAG